MEKKTPFVALGKPARTASIEKGRRVTLEFDEGARGTLGLIFPTDAVPAVVRTLANAYTMARGVGGQEDAALWINPEHWRVGLIEDHVCLGLSLVDGGEFAWRLTRAQAGQIADALREFARPLG